MQDIPSYIRGQLGSPVLDVGLWRPAVIGAAMPEAPIDEDRDFALGEGDVWANQPPVGPNRVVLAEPQPLGMDCAAKQPFRRRIRPTYGSHIA